MPDNATYAGALSRVPAQQRNADPRVSKTVPADPRLYDFEAERSVLSAIFLDSSSLNTVMTAMGVQQTSETLKKELRLKGESPEALHFRSVANVMFQDPVHDTQLHLAIMSP